ncbi:DUF1573 domain-containing protein [Hymenobacter bucti]|uniref:DUF1573 domain-containing protein n=1 Tax=Hymenobacter bucti TaxID=1844114 RepID=A0ABW4QUU5_9BACT
MNKVLLLALGLAFAGSYTAQAQTTAAATKTSGAQIKFSEEKYDFGSIKQGDVVDHVFKFKNTGTQPLVISNVQASCGCTIPDWTKEPVGPGKMGMISAKFNSAGKMGMQTKVLTIESNAAAGAATVSLVGEVKDPTAASATADVNTADAGKQKTKDGDAKLKAKVKKS